MNQSLWKRIRKLSEFGNKQWECCVEEAVRAVNISFHRALGTSPFVFRFGRLPELPIDALNGLPIVRERHRKIKRKKT